MTTFHVHFNGSLLNINDDQGRETGPLSIGEALEHIAYMHYQKGIRFPMQSKQAWEEHFSILSEFISSDFEYTGSRSGSSETPADHRESAQAQDPHEPGTKV